MILILHRVEIKIRQKPVLVMVASTWCMLLRLTCAKDYCSSQPGLGKKPTPPESPLHIENPMDKPKIAPCIPKGVLNHSGKNPNARATQNYLVVDNLGQNPCAMSMLEVL